MGEATKIQWAHDTFNPWRGCTKISDGCTHCYADTMAKRNPAVLGIWGDNGTRVFASEAKWKEPLKWNKEARMAGERRRVFCASMADVFEDWDGPMVSHKGLPYWWCKGSISNSPIPSTGLGEGCRLMTMRDVREHLCELVWDTPHLDWLLLTKRIENAARLLWEMGFINSPLTNYWLGTTTENQEQADKRIPILLKTPAPIRWLSMEPLLGPVNLNALNCVGEPGEGGEEGFYRDCLSGRDWHPEWECGESWSGPLINWVIVGGESGPKARRCDLGWIRSIVDQCRAAGVPVFVKQLGTVWARENGARDNHGGDPDEWPSDLRVREFPQPVASEAT